jgi:pimeloyl-ACP methyl ester carboxylesterase
VAKPEGRVRRSGTTEEVARCQPANPWSSCHTPASPAARKRWSSWIAGSRDFFYPDPIVRETAERIPQATLRLYDGVGHAVSKTHKRRFEDDVLGFLRR